MSKEIERKFLLDLSKTKALLDLAKEKGLLKGPSALTQTYLTLSENEEVRVRMIVEPNSNSPKYLKTTKRPISDDGLIREETEYSIEKSVYDDAIKQIAPSTKPIKKLRYELKIEKRTLEIDIYLDYLGGLATGEIEFPSEEEARAFDHRKYDFIIDNITKDKRYKNAQMAKNGIPSVETPKRRNSVVEKE